MDSLGDGMLVVFVVLLVMGAGLEIQSANTGGESDEAEDFRHIGK